MKSSLLRFVIAGLSLSLTVACQKKVTPVAEVAREAEKQLPAGEQVAPPADPAAAPAASPVVASASTTPADQAAYEVWFKKHNLDLNDKKMLDADADEDGFTNRDEFLA